MRTVQREARHVQRAARHVQRAACNICAIRRPTDQVCADAQCLCVVSDCGGLVTVPPEDMLPGFNVEVRCRGTRTLPLGALPLGALPLSCSHLPSCCPLISVPAPAAAIEPPRLLHDRGSPEAHKRVRARMRVCA
jgi:hypothetical protein